MSVSHSVVLGALGTSGFKRASTYFRVPVAIGDVRFSNLVYEWSFCNLELSIFSTDSQKRSGACWPGFEHQQLDDRSATCEPGAEALHPCSLEANRLGFRVLTRAVEHSKQAFKVTADKHSVAVPPSYVKKTSESLDFRSPKPSSPVSLSNPKQ